MAKLLIENDGQNWSEKLDVNKTGFDGMTPLHAALAHGDHEIAMLLLSKPDGWFKEPLNLTIRNEKRDMETGIGQSCLSIARSWSKEENDVYDQIVKTIESRLKAA